MEVLELMRVHVNSITPDAALTDAVDIMDLYQVVIIPVVDEENRPIGVVSESDIEDALLIPFETARSSSNAPGNRTQAAVAHARSLRIRDIMTAPAVTVDERADILDAATLLRAHGLKRLPVTSEGRLIGTIGRIEICQAVLETCAS